MNRWTARHRITAVTLSCIFALVDSLRDPLSHLDLRELARVVSCHTYHCVNVNPDEE